jgi:hypothetical protein
MLALDKHRRAIGGIAGVAALGAVVAFTRRGT